MGAQKEGRGNEMRWTKQSLKKMQEMKEMRALPFRSLILCLYRGGFPTIYNVNTVTLADGLFTYKNMYT